MFFDLINYFIKSSLNKKGSKSFTPSIIMVSVSPYNNIRMGCSNRLSVSANTCLHAPQGVMGLSVKPFSERAAIAIMVIG